MGNLLRHFVLVLALSNLVLADQTVFLWYSSDTGDPYYPYCIPSSPPKLKAFYSNANCPNIYSDGPWTAPTSLHYTCYDQYTVGYQHCRNGCCSVIWYIDNDSRTMNAACTLFTSDQTFRTD